MADGLNICSEDVWRTRTGADDADFHPRFQFFFFFPLVP